MLSREFVLQGRNGTILRNMDTTYIFLFLAIFEQNLTVLHQNIIFFIYQASQLAIFMNYPHAKCYTISSNINRTDIFQFLVIFAQILPILP